MASPNFYKSLNLAGTVFENGPETLQLDGDVWLSGSVQWLDTIDGDNANSGFLPELPVATLAQAVSNLPSVNCLIIIGEGSYESLAAAQTFGTVGTSVFGCGVGSSRPRYTCTGAVNMFDVTAAACWFEGIYFPASTAAATSRVAFTAANGTVRSCYFENGAQDTNRAVRIHTGANSCRVRDTSFVVTGSRPAIGLEVSAAVTDFETENVTFDGGAYGWTDYAYKVSAAATRTRDIGLTLLNRSDMTKVTATTYQSFGVNMGGTGNVNLVA